MIVIARLYPALSQRKLWQSLDFKAALRLLVLLVIKRRDGGFV